MKAVTALICIALSVSASADVTSILNGYQHGRDASDSPENTSDVIQGMSYGSRAMDAPDNSFEVIERFEYGNSFEAPEHDRNDEIMQPWEPESVIQPWEPKSFFDD